MRYSKRRRWFLPVFLGLMTLTAQAEGPVPLAKPLDEGRGPHFIEGIDVPRSKPETVKTVPDANRRDAKCELSGAQFVQREPVSGGLEGSFLDDEACGIGNPIGLKAVGEEETEISFPADVLISCDFAQVVSDWLLRDVVPAAEKHLASPLVTIGSGPGYQCRRRNNLPDGKLSEHALGKALDISFFRFGNGTTISIEEDWSRDAAQGRFLKEIHAAACERFTTVLGPDADPNHKSHFHLDIGCHGQDCTFIICQ